MKKLTALSLILATLVFFSPLPASAVTAIAFDNSTVCFNNAGSITSGCTMTVSGSNTLVMVACQEATAQSVTSVTVNSVTATLIDVQNVTGGTFVKVYDYYVVGQSGSNLAIAVNVNNSTNNYCAIQSYNGVSQSNPIDNHTTNVTNSGTSLTTTLTVNTANSWLIAFGGYTNANTNTNSGLAGAGTTRRTVGPNANDPTPWYANFDSNGALGTGSQSLVINRGDTGQISVNEVSIAPATATTFNPFLFWIVAF